MKIVRPIPPIAVWKQPRAFVLGIDPKPVLYSWVQFRIMLYLAGGLIGLWWLGQLNPSRSTDAPGFWAILGLSFLTGGFVAYGLPLITYFAPRFVRLYPSYLVTVRGLSVQHFRFGLISMYSLKQQDDGWVLRLLDLDAKESLIAFIPNGDIKTKVKMALNAAGVSENILPPAAVLNRREVDMNFTIRLKSYRKSAQQYDKSSAFWFVGILLVNAVLAILIERYFPNNTAFSLIELTALFCVIGGYCFMIVRYKKRLGIANGLDCPHCRKMAINQTFMHALECTHTCAYCGKLYYSLDN